MIRWAFAAVLATLAFLAVVLWLDATAAEAYDEKVMKDVEPTSLSLLEYAVEPAMEYWTAQGFQAACRPQLFLYDEVGKLAKDVEARATVGGCEVYWNRRAFRETLRESFDPWRALAAQGLRNICQTTAHEIGHNLGIDKHADYGLMDPYGGEWTVVLPDGSTAGGIIPECKRWARSILDDRQRRTDRCPTKRCVRRLARKRLDSARIDL